MERLVRVIARCGGDIFKFAGDAMLVLWPPSDTETDEKDLALMVHRAAQVRVVFLICLCEKMFV